MGCGCNQSRPPIPLPIAEAAMCGVCRHLDRPGGVRCNLDRRDALSRPCPLGRHPDARGVVVCADLEFKGVPKFVRWAYECRWFRRLIGGGGRIPTADLPGCGCYVPLKDEWARVRSWWAARGRVPRPTQATLVSSSTNSHGHSRGQDRPA